MTKTRIKYAEPEMVEKWEVVEFETDYQYTIGQVIQLDNKIYEVTNLGKLNTGAFRVTADDRFTINKRFNSQFANQGL